MNHSRLLLFVAAVCLLLAALITAFGLDLGPAWAWAFGGGSAWVLSAAV